VAGGRIGATPLYPVPVTAAQQLPFETASWGRRVLALAVDWFASILVVMVFVGPRGWAERADSGLLTLGVFVLESALLTGTAGGSFGKLMTRLRVVRTDGSGKPVGLLLAFARQILVALVIPPLVFRPDRRGLHDLAASSATVTLDQARAEQRR
jgi:uncharacterized RDD family membrane protein YckC